MFESFGSLAIHETNNLVATKPAIYMGSFEIPHGTEPGDSFLRLDGWGKGVAFLNGHNLGRYWPQEGPQVTLYAPSSWFLGEELNYVALFETDYAPCMNSSMNCAVNWVVNHVINGTVPV